MRKLALAALVLMISAPAYSWEAQTRCSFGRHYSVCTRSVSEPIKIVPLTDDEVKARAEREAKWDAFCQPKKTVDDEGMTRLVYAHPGCANGRSE